MRQLHPMVPMGVLVGFCWIVAFAVMLRSCETKKPANEMVELTRRMCSCQDRECVEEVDREAAKLSRSRRDTWGKEDDALEAFGAEQDLQACRREALKRLR